MTNDDLLEFLQYSLFKKLVGMNNLNRIMFMNDLFGKRWIEVYNQLCDLYPSLIEAP